MSSDFVFTVLGPVAPAELGVVDAHSHVWIEPVPGADPNAPVLFDATAVIRELRQFRAAGGSAVVDCQPGGCGRNGRMLQRLALQGGVHLVACTGFHRRRYYPPNTSLWQMTTADAAALFVSELTFALTETSLEPQPLRAGFIKVAGEATLAETPQQLLAAAAEACRATGCAIQMHTEKGAAVEQFLRFFVDHGVAPQRLVFCHVDKRPDFEFHRTIAQSGAMLEYDTFFRPKYQPETTVWPLIEKMVAAGLETQVALATDLAESSLWRQFGGQPGMAAFVTIVKARLQELAFNSHTIHQLMGENIARRLAIPSQQEERP